MAIPAPFSFNFISTHCPIPRYNIFHYIFKEITFKQLENVEDLKDAHKVRNRIIYEKDFTIDKKTAGSVIETYENLLKELDYI